MKSILLFGGSGFLSKNLLAFGLKNNYKFFSVTRGLKNTLNHKNLNKIKADRDKIDCKNFLKNYKFDLIIDCNFKSEKHSKQLVNLSQEHTGIIAISSDYVYNHFFRKLNQNEKNAIYTDFDSMGYNKRKAEIYIEKNQDKNLYKYLVFRPPHIYGPGSLPGTIPQHGRDKELIKKINKSIPLKLIHNGLGLIQPIYVHDFVRIIFYFIENNLLDNQIYNCPGPSLMTHKEYYSAIAKALDKQLIVDETFTTKIDKENPFPYNHRYYDNKKISKYLNNFKYTKFDEGISHWLQELDS